MRTAKGSAVSAESAAHVSVSSFSLTHSLPPEQVRLAAEGAHRMPTDQRQSRRPHTLSDPMSVRCYRALRCCSPLDATTLRAPAEHHLHIEVYGGAATAD